LHHKASLVGFGIEKKLKYFAFQESFLGDLSGLRQYEFKVQFVVAFLRIT
jgi:hypothetical protein